jgi:hypothetical protein
VASSRRARTKSKTYSSWSMHREPLRPWGDPLSECDDPSEVMSLFCCRLQLAHIGTYALPVGRTYCRICATGIGWGLSAGWLSGESVDDGCNDLAGSVFLDVVLGVG